MLHLALGGFSLLVGAAWALANAWALWLGRRTGRRHSTVPIVGAGFLAGGLFFIPATRSIAWVGFFLDPATWVLLAAIPKVAREAWSTAPWNLEQERLGKAGRMTALLRLYRGGAFTLVQRIARAADEPGIVGAGTLGRWRREGERVVLEGDEGARVVLAPSDGGGWRKAEGPPGLRKNPDLALDGVVFERRR
jgi:hypothetical protein